MYVCMYVCMQLCMYVIMYVCNYVCMYVCVYIYMYMYTHLFLLESQKCFSVLAKEGLYHQLFGSVACFFGVPNS